MENTWDKTTEFHERAMPFMPPEGYVSYQNPPDFTWAGIPGAEKYDLIICDDGELENIKYFKCGLKYNFCNFDCTFDTGKYYYWSVRCYKDGIPTEWSSPRAFRIHPKANEFPVPDIEDIMENIPRSHPRIVATADTLAEVRALKDKNSEAKRIFDTYIEKAEECLAEGFCDSEPPFTPFEDWVLNAAYLQKYRGQVHKIINKAFACAFSYLLTGEKKYAELGVKLLLEISSWDIDGGTSYKNQDQVHREIAYNVAIAYDWLYDAMTEEERAPIVDMVRRRTKVMEYLLPRLKDSPYDSHGWTAFGYIGIIAICCFDEIPESKDWLRQIIPQYTVILPPWSYQDGGWSQGTDYWQYSTNSNKEFIDILASSGIFNLYNKTWMKNEYLWSLYVYPNGQYGSFGDQSNRTKAAVHYSGSSLYKGAYFNNSGTEKWLAEQIGGIMPNWKNYHVTKVADIEAKCPSNYPLAHHFRDIGWVVMADDILTPDRIMLTFKSSKFGSFNHSHADQNSFIIGAYGENLAIKSGYYDAYHSKHDKGLTRASHAHNTVTLSGSRGQKDDMMSANGRITAFLNGKELDLAGGDATPAYLGALKKFERHIVYVRPDVFIAVDKLKTNGEPEKFEWWLNAEHDIEITDGGKGAVLREGCAVLDADVCYPENIRAEVINTFSGSDGVVYPAEGRYTDANVQRRVYFETEAVTDTKMVVAMGVHRDGEPKKRIKSESCGDYLKLTVEDKCTVYVNLGCKCKTVKTRDGIEFTGAIAAISKGSCMLADGISLIKDGRALITFDKNASAAVGCGEIGIFTDCDNMLTVGTGNTYAPVIEKLTDRDGFEASSAIGIDSVDCSYGECRLSIRADQYSLKF